MRFFSFSFILYFPCVLLHSLLLTILSSHDPSECYHGAFCCHEETKEIQGRITISFDTKEDPHAPFGIFTLSFILAHKTVLGIDPDVSFQQQQSSDKNSRSLTITLKRRKVDEV